MGSLGILVTVESSIQVVVLVVVEAVVVIVVVVVVVGVVLIVVADVFVTLSRTPMANIKSTGNDEVGEGRGGVLKTN